MVELGVMKAPLDPYFLLFKVSDLLLNSPYLKIGIVILGIFIFILLLGWARKHIFKISMRGATFGFVLGIILVLLLDLIIIAAMADKSKFQKLFSKDKRGEALGEVVISGITNLNQVLGVSIMVASRKPQTAQEVLNELLLLPPDQSQKVKNLFCPE